MNLSKTVMYPSATNVYSYTSCSHHQEKQKSFTIVKNKDDNEKHDTLFIERYSEERNHSMRANSLKKNIKLPKQIKFNKKKNEFINEAIDLNIKAMQSAAYIILPSDLADTRRLKDAIEMLNEAIHLDSSYHFAYMNKADLLRRLGQNEMAIKTLDQLIRFKPDYAEAHCLLGFTYERIGSMDSANVKYEMAIASYSLRISETADINDKINRAFILSLLDKEKGLLDINNLMKNYPDEDILPLLKKQLFEEFNREEFISTSQY